MSKQKQKRDNKLILQITLVGMGLILLVFLLTSINAKEVKPSTPNYLGSAQLHLIPTNYICSHSQEVYTSTGVVITNQQDGSKYLILQSKFGDESCLTRIS